MHREHRQWHSPALGRTMELLVFGHAGTPLITFPSSMGRFYEWEDFGMIEALRPQIENGHNMVLCLDSVDGESFYNKSVDPYVRIARYRQFEQYVMDEVVPFATHLSGGAAPMTAGASFGGYHAANLVLKHPQRFSKLISLSGAFDVRSFLGGFYNDDVYFNNPSDFVPHLPEGDQLHALRHTPLVLTVGEHDPCRGSNEHLHRVLNDKHVSHTFDFLTGAFGHDWPWWRSLIQKYIV